MESFTSCSLLRHYLWRRHSRFWEQPLVVDQPADEAVQLWQLEWEDGAVPLGLWFLVRDRCMSYVRANASSCSLWVAIIVSSEAHFFTLGCSYVVSMCMSILIFGVCMTTFLFLLTTVHGNMNPCNQSAGATNMGQQLTTPLMWVALVLHGRYVSACMHDWGNYAMACSYHMFIHCFNVHLKVPMAFVFRDLQNIYNDKISTFHGCDDYTRHCLFMMCEIGGHLKCHLLPTHKHTSTVFCPSLISIQYTVKIVIYIYTYMYIYIYIYIYMYIRSIPDQKWISIWNHLTHFG